MIENMKIPKGYQKYILHTHSIKITRTFKKVERNSRDTSRIKKHIVWIAPLCFRFCEKQSLKVLFRQCSSSWDQYNLQSGIDQAKMSSTIDHTNMSSSIQQCVV